MSASTEYEVIEDGLVLFRSPEATEKARYNDCLIWLARYNKKHPKNRAKIRLSPETQLLLF